MQHSLEHKQQLEAHMLRLQTLAQDNQQNSQRSRALARHELELRQQLSQAGDMLRLLRRAAPTRRQGKVVSIVAG